MKLRILTARFISKSTSSKIHARVFELKKSNSSFDCIASTPEDGVRINEIPHLLEFTTSKDSLNDNVTLRIEIKSNNTIHIGDVSHEVWSKLKFPIWCNLSTGKEKEFSGCIKIGVARSRPKTFTDAKPAVILDFDCTVSKHHLWGTLNKWPMCVSDFMETFPKEKERPPMDPNDSAFITYIMGGKDRIDMLRDYFEKLVSIGTTMYVTISGYVRLKQYLIIHISRNRKKKISRSKTGTYQLTEVRMMSYQLCSVMIFCNIFNLFKATTVFGFGVMCFERTKRLD